MRAIHRRIRRLEEKWAPEPVSRGPTPADILRERRRRWQATGEPLKEPTPVWTSEERRRLSVAEILLRGRQLAYERNRTQVSSVKPVAEGGRPLPDT
jgi:hypothetical protein